MAIETVDAAYKAASNNKVQSRHFSKDLGASFNTTDPPVHLFGYGDTPPAGTYDATKAGQQIVGSDTGVLEFTNPTNPAFLHLQSAIARYLSGTVTAGGAPALVVIDHLVHYGGFDASVSGNQNPTNPSSPMLPRYQDGFDVQMAAVVSVASVGASAPTLTLTYDDETDTSRTVAFVLRTDGSVVGRVVHGSDYFIPIPEKGVKQLTQFSLSGSSGLSGDIAILLFKVLGIIPLDRQIKPASFLSGDQGILPRIFGDAALDFFLVNGSTSNLSTFGVSGDLFSLEG